MKLTVVCFGFEPSNLRKQPWRYMHELIKDLPDEWQLTVITDVDRANTAGIRIRSVEAILSLSGPTDELLTAIGQEDPDIVVSLVGQTSFLRPSTIASKIDKPTVGIFGGPVYSPRQVLSVGVKELYRHYPYLAVHLAGSLVPDRLLKSRASAFECIITLTHENRTRLNRTGIETQVSTVPAGIDEFDFERPDSESIATVREEINSKSVPTILYFTSPLTLRGTDTLIKAFAQVRRKEPCKLVILSRQDSGGLSQSEAHLRQLASDQSVSASFELVPRNLSPEGVKEHLAAVDLVVLPFKIVQASVPISLLETMAVGTPLISTKIDGIPEIVDDDRQLVEAGDTSSLAAAMESFVTNPELRRSVRDHNRNRMQSYQRWEDARSQFLAILEECV